MSIKNADDRILAYFSLFDKLIKDNGLHKTFDHDDCRKSKKKCRHLIEGLRPMTLKTVVQRAIKYGDDEEAVYDPRKLFDLVLRSQPQSKKNTIASIRGAEPANPQALTRENDRTRGAFGQVT
jgi:hypothetical protein